MALTAAQQAALNRLASYYEGNNPYNASTNPGGLRQGGQVVNFVPALQDVASAVQGAASLIADALAAATNSPKAVRVDSALAFSTAEMITGLGNLGLLGQYLALTPAQQAAFRLNIGAASNDDLRGVGRYVAKQAGMIIQTGKLAIDEFGDLTGVDPSSVNANLQNGQVVNQALEPYTVELLQFDGAVGATTTSGARGHAITLGSGAALSATQVKFGATSLACNGSSAGFATLAASADWAINSGDFTIEGFYYVNSGDGCYFSVWNSSNDFIQAVSFNGVLCLQTQGGLVIQGPSRPAGVMGHYALERYGTATTLYLNGTSVGSISNATLPGGTPVFYVGGSPVGYYLNGYADGVRFSKGIARYKGNFTPPTAAFVAGTSGALDLKSIPFTVENGITPTKASILIVAQAQSGGPIVPGTNLMAQARRAATGAYAAFPLQSVITLGGWTTFRADGLDLSGLPAGTGPNYEITCPASLGLVIDAVEFGYGA